MEYSLDSIRAAPWAITPDRLQIIADLPTLGSGEARAPSVPAPMTIRGIGVLRLVGVLVPQASALGEQFGLLGLRRFTAGLHAALADDAVSGILIDIDSPGGSVFGVQELSDEIYKARSQKPVIAIANSLAASAAYWIGSSASEFYITPGGDVGSIGVFAVHRNVGKALDRAGVNVSLISAGRYKTEASPFAPLTVAAKAYLQSQVDTRYGAFTRTVARNRGANVDAVRNGMGEGRTLDATNAIAEKMADGIATFDQVLGKLARRVGGQRTMADSAILRLITR